MYSQSIVDNAWIILYMDSCIIPMEESLALAREEPEGFLGVKRVLDYPEKKNMFLGIFITVFFSKVLLNWLMHATLMYCRAIKHKNNLRVIWRRGKESVKC